MHFSLAAGLAFIACATALPHELVAGRANTIVALTSTSSYNWTVTDWTAVNDDANSTFSFSVSAPSTTEGGSTIPPFDAVCSGTGINTGPWPCTGLPAATNTSEAAVNAYLQTSNDSSLAAVVISYQYATISGGWETEYNWTAYASEPWGTGLTFETSPSYVWGVA
ncbi:hypothetical protein BD289DRAFT_425527 [Coniella lustricola]|uniref:AA1-like domain-containing protein n=1 Tax=Coniella lustricola TaxID=2025994 RepID=A0A2T3AHE3_9PEZI|nr:hypothetical protein BD289DRAFT_425527 [Coniella lustricola]